MRLFFIALMIATAPSIAFARWFKCKITNQNHETLAEKVVEQSKGTVEVKFEDLTCKTTVIDLGSEMDSGISETTFILPNGDTIKNGVADRSIQVLEFNDAYTCTCIKGR